jgi:NADPH:quinone reductase
MTRLSFDETTLGPDEVLIQVKKRPVHVGDFHIVRNAPQGGPSTPISARLGANPAAGSCGDSRRVGVRAKREHGLSPGRRVAFSGQEYML